MKCSSDKQSPFFFQLVIITVHMQRTPQNHHRMTTKLPHAREVGEEEGRELTGLVMSLGVQGGGGEGGSHMSC